MGFGFNTKPSLQKIDYDIFTIYHRYYFETSSYQDEDTGETIDEVNYYVDYTSYILFVNGMIKINPTTKSLLEYERPQVDFIEGLFDEREIKYISEGKKVETKRFSEPINFKLYDRNLEAYERLLELKKIEKAKNISTKKRLKSIKFILKEFKSWLEINSLVNHLETNIKNYNPITQDKSGPLLTDNSNDLNNVEIKKQKSPHIRPQFVWNNSKEVLNNILETLAKNKFLDPNGELDVVIKNHFDYKGKRNLKSIDEKHLITWIASDYELCYLIKELLSSHLSCGELHPFKMITLHFQKQKSIKGSESVTIKPFNKRNLESGYSNYSSKDHSVKKSKRSRELRNLVKAELE